MNEEVRMRGFPRPTGYRYVGPRQLAAPRTGVDAANELLDALEEGLADAARKAAPVARTGLYALRRAMWANVAIPLVVGGVGQLLYGSSQQVVPVGVTNLGGWVPWGMCMKPSQQYIGPPRQWATSASFSETIKSQVNGCLAGQLAGSRPPWPSPPGPTDRTIVYAPTWQSTTTYCQWQRGFSRPVTSVADPVPTIHSPGTQFIPVTGPRAVANARPVPGTIPFEPAIAPVRDWAKEKPQSWGGERVPTRPGYLRPGVMIEVPEHWVPGSRPVVKPHENKPPPKNTKEHKARAKGRTAAAIYALGAAVSAVTETLDVVEALYWAIPWEHRRKYTKWYRTGDKGKNDFVWNGQTIRAKPSWKTMTEAVFEEWDHIDPAKAARNLLENQAGDMAFGGLSRATKGALKKAVDKGFTHSNRNPLPTRLGADYGMGSIPTF